MPMPLKRQRIKGLDPVYLLAVRPKKGKQPTRFLTDLDSHPLEGPTTTQMTKVRTWNDSSGPRHFLRRHPKLKKQFMPFAWVGVAIAPGKHLPA